MKAFIRLILAFVIGAAFSDYHGIRPEYFNHLVDTWGIYAYAGASLVVAWLCMPAVTEYIFE